MDQHDTKWYTDDGRLEREEISLRGLRNLREENKKLKKQLAEANKVLNDDLWRKLSNE